MLLKLFPHDGRQHFLEQERPDDGGNDPEWSWRYEQRYGAPKLKNRESVLRITLKVPSDGGRRDIQPVVATLQQITHRAFETARLGLALDHQREDAEEAELIHRNLKLWLARAVRLRERSSPDDLPTGRRFRRTYESMLTALTFDEPMTDQDRAKRDWLFAPRPVAMTRRRRKHRSASAGILGSTV